jgi:hypothetical protein
MSTIVMGRSRTNHLKKESRQKNKNYKDEIRIIKKR